MIYLISIFSVDSKTLYTVSPSNPCDTAGFSVLRSLYTPKRNRSGLLRKNFAGNSLFSAIIRRECTVLSTAKV